MSRKIIIYNSFTHDANPHVTLLKTQLVEVNKELLTCKANDRKMLVNERRLLQSKLRSQDASLSEMGASAKKTIERFIVGSLSRSDALQTLMAEGFSTQTATRILATSLAGLVQRKLRAQDTGEKYWTYQSSTPTPSLEEAIKLGAIAANTTEEKWHQLSPGMRREIVRSKQRKSEQKDGMGSPEEVAYGVGYGSDFKENPYSDPDQAKAWERGKRDGIVAKKFHKNSYVGGVRGQAFKEPKIKPGPVQPGYAAGGGRQSDFKSERGYVGKIVNSANGKLLARSEPMISENSAKRWAAEQAPKFRTMRTKQEFEMVFYDPDRIAADKL